MIYSLAQRSPNIPAVTSEEYRQMIVYGNVVKQTWFDTPDTQWESKRADLLLKNAPVEPTEEEPEPPDPTPLLIGAERSYIIRDMGDLSTDEDDVVEITTYNEDGTTNSIYPFEIVDAAILAQYRRNRFAGGIGAVSDFQLKYRPCAIYGGRLHFAEIFTETDSEFGGQISFPHYVRPVRLDMETNLDEEIDIDSPMYFVYETAATMARAGFVKVSNSQDFVAKAIDVMAKMKQVNGRDRQARVAVRAPGIYG